MEDGYISWAKAIAEMTANNLLAHEVIHAYWIDENPEDLLDVRMRCSNCHTIHAPYAYWHYCPSCGAKMDGGQSK